jgi:hypothetical protein
MPIDPTLQAKGMAAGAAMPNKFSGIGDTIRAITNDLRSSKQNKDKTIADNRNSNSTIIAQLLKSGYRPTDMTSFNKVLETGELPGFTKGGADSILGQAPIGMKIKGATTNPEGETSYSYEPNIKTGKTLVDPQIDKISKNEDSYFTLGNSVNTLNANKDKFAKFMGPGKGALRHPLLSYGSQDLQDFLAWKANVQDAFQQYRVAVTGAQASDKEIALLAKNRPTENDTYDVFIKKTTEVRKTGNQVLRRYIANLARAGYDISGYQDTLEALNSEMQGLQMQSGGNKGTLSTGMGYTIGE